SCTSSATPIISCSAKAIRASGICCAAGSAIIFRRRRRRKKRQRDCASEGGACPAVPGAAPCARGKDAAIGARCRACAPRAKRKRGGRRPRVGRGRAKGGQGRLVHDVDRKSGGPPAQTRIREGLSRHRAAIYARRRNADRRENSRGRRG